MRLLCRPCPARSRASARSRSSIAIASGSSLSSRSRLNAPPSRMTEPPVTAPPAWATSPVMVTALHRGGRCPSAARAVIRSSVTSVRPSSEATIGAISAGAETRSAATPRTPGKPSALASKPLFQTVRRKGVHRLKGGTARARLLQMGNGRLGVRPCGHHHVLKAIPERDLDGDFEGLWHHEQLRHGAPDTFEPPVTSRRERIPHAGVQTGAALVHPPQHIQPRRCFAECAMQPVDFSSNRRSHASSRFQGHATAR